MASTPYLELLDAVESYYGAGSDEWLQIATSSYIQSTEWYNILSQTPGVNITTNKAGEIVSYTVDKSWSTATGSASSVINSNTQAAELANASKLYYPADTAINTTTGQVAANSGMKSVTSGATVSTVVKDVALGIAAVATGVQLGAKIDATLYGLDPDFWNEHGMRAIDPQTWDSICSTKMGKNVFNMVFGINKNTGTTQAYLDQNAVALIAKYMQTKGAFSTDEGTGSITDHTGLSPETIANMPFPFSMGLVYDGSYKSGVGPTDAPPSNAITNVISGTDPIYIFVTLVNDNIAGYACSKTSFTIEVTRHNFYGVYNRDYSGTRSTVNNESVFWANIWNANTSQGTPITPSPISTNTALVPAEIAYVLCYGERTTGVPGITRQSGATIPNGITDAMTVDDTLDYLRTLYPDVFTDAISNDVIQPDGSVKTYTYIPVGFPDSVPFSQLLDHITPTGGTDTTQANPSINPTTTPESLIEELIKVLSATDPDNPQTPGETTDYPDTGDGTTPGIVMPTGAASALYSVYNPTQAEINSFGSWLWSSSFVDQIMKLFNDPMQAIIGLHKVFATPPTSGTGSITVGYLDSGVSSKLVSSQYTEVNCGTINLREYFGNVLDYTETDLYLYLPFIGIVPVNAKDLMRSSINVRYKVDVFTGACLAIVNVHRDNDAGGQLYCYSGNCAVQYPLSSGSYMGIVTGILGVAGSVAGTIASGGSLLPMALGVGASALGGAKTQVQHSGSITGNAGAMGIKKPYLIIRRPQAKLATNFENFNGVANNKTAPLSSFTGYTKVNYVHLENINATDNELDEIKAQLKNGVII